MSARYLIDNLWDTSIYRDHALDAQEEAAGKEVERLADGRRAARDNWQPTTANAERWAETITDRVRAADMLVIDREHNLSGATVSLRVSQDDFVTYTTAFSGVVPSGTFANSSLDGMPVVRTWEGALLFKFPMVAGTYWRLYVGAMGAGIVPRISGLWCGLSWSPSKGPLLAGYDDESGDLSVPQVMTPALWSGSGRIARRRSPTLSHLIADEAEWMSLRYHIDLYNRGWPMWVVPSEDEAEKAILARSDGGSYGVGFSGNRLGRDLTLSVPEYQPRARRSM